MLQPGACSPSRSVVSKKVMLGFSIETILPGNGKRSLLQRSLIQRSMLVSRRAISQSYISSDIIIISYSISGTAAAEIRSGKHGLLSTGNVSRRGADKKLLRRGHAGASHTAGGEPDGAQAGRRDRRAAV